MLVMDEIVVSGHACYTFSMRTGCRLEEAAEKIREMLPLAIPANPNEAKTKRLKKQRKRKYYKYEDYTFVLNENGTAVVTILTKDNISTSLF